MPIPPELIDADAEKIVRRLVGHKYQAYLVGGCVRDLLLERTPKDFDIATSATPQEIKDLFRNCRIIGRRFRLAHIFFGPKIIETATFRANPLSELEAGEESAEPDLLIRRDNVFGSAEQDARRRDFTINGLFYDLEADQVIDYVGGLADLVARTVLTIGDPDIRFREDPVRILRAIKFAGRLSFSVEPATWNAILTHKGEIPKCAAPRVLEELYRLLRGGAARRSMELMIETGVLALLVPELDRRLVGEGSDTVVVKQWWDGLDRLDVRVRSGYLPSNAVLLSLISAPFVGLELFEEGEDRPGDVIRDIGLLIDERIRPLFEQIRVSRRDSERTRQMLFAQRRLAPSRRRRSRPMALVQRDYFKEALEVFELLSPVIQPGLAIEDELERWRTLLQDAMHGGVPSNETEGAGAPDGEPRRRRRRRRGGRKRRRRIEEASVPG